MGCGYSKLNEYRRRKRNSKNAAAVDTDDSEEEYEYDVEEEEGSSEASPEDNEPEYHQPDTRQHVLPISEHQPTFELTVSQQDFFKMLDEKIEQGKDYDPTSESEIRLEEERRRKLIEFWYAHCRPAESPVSQASPPPTPADKRRLTRSVSKASERHCAPSTSRQCRRQEHPTRGSHSVQTHDPRPSTSTEWDPKKSPVKRTQSGPSWRNCPKVAPMPEPKKGEAAPGCSNDSQITYNPTFQNQSPAHSAKSQSNITQIVSLPLTQHVAPASPTKYIAPPEQYKDGDVSSVERQVTVTQTQSQIYYIDGSSTAAGAAPDIVQQRQQTAIHLKQYVAMKQAQQQMFSSYVQRTSRALLPDGDYPATTPRMCEGEELAAQYGYPALRPHTASNRTHHAQVSHMNTPTWSPLPPVMTTQWPEGQVPPEMQYYPQSQFVPLFRANSAGSAGTLTRYHKKVETEKIVHTITVVRGKPVGQVVAVGEQELAVSSIVSDSPSPVSVSTDSGVSPGTSAPSSKSSSTSPAPTTSANETEDAKPKKKSSNKRTVKLSKSFDV